MIPVSDSGDSNLSSLFPPAPFLRGTYNIAPLMLLPGRDQRTLAGWFRKYPEIQVVSRDRGGIYAMAARGGAPQARQVADHWHLLKNIGDALERMMYKHMPLNYRQK